MTAQKSAPSISWGPHTGQDYWAIADYSISIGQVIHETIPLDIGNPNTRSFDISFEGDKAAARSVYITILINDGERTVSYYINAIRTEE